MSSTNKSAVLTLLHTCCGSGILALPFAFKANGLILSVMAIIFSGFCALAGLLCQAEITKYVRNKRNLSFFAVSKITYPSLGVFFDIAIAVKCFGVSVSYLIVAGDLLPQIFQTFTSNPFFYHRELHIMALLIFVIGPLCFLRKLGSLKIASMVAISTVVYLCLMVVLNFLFPSADVKASKGTVSLWKPSSHFQDTNSLKSFPIFVFAYTCHHNTFSVVNELQNNTLKSIRVVALSAMSLACILYTVIGISGYLTFGDNIKGNIITMYPSSVLTTIGRIAIVVLVTLAYPLQCHPCRASIHHIYEHFASRNSNKNVHSGTGVIAPRNPLPTGEHNPLIATVSPTPTDELIEEGSPKITTSELDSKTFTLITCCILLASLLLAITVKSLATMLSVVGATGSTSIAFILPGLFAHNLIGSEFRQTRTKLPTWTRVKKNFALGLSLWGVLVMVTALSSTLFF
ncbi:hypothetical protein ACO0QE_004210 [Hanseniaspora vineae]